MVLSDWVNYQNQETGKFSTSVASVASVAIDTSRNQKNLANLKSELARTVATVATVTSETFKNSNFIETDKNKKLNSKIEFKDKTTVTVATVATVKPFPAYITQRMDELFLTTEDVRGETDPVLVLEPEELNDIRNDKRLFDIWIEHVHRHKQLRALEIAKQKQADEYTLDDTLGSLPFDHKFKITEHVLTTFKKYLSGERYNGEAPNSLFVECWFLANHDLTLEQLFNASAKFVQLVKVASNCCDNMELKRLRGVSENPEGFRIFCLEEFKNCNFAEES